MKKFAFLLALFSATSLQAQLVPYVAQSLSKEAAAGVVSQAVLSSAAKNALLQISLANTTQSALVSRSLTLSLSVFSDAEKALLQMPRSAGAQLGLASALYDQNAVLYNALQSKGEVSVTPAEFEAHQQALAQIASNIEQQLTASFGTAAFSDTPLGKILRQVDCGANLPYIQRFFEGIPQPLFPVISKTEMETFANLPTLEAQMAYVEDSIALAQEQLTRILSQDLSTLSPETLETYYLQKVRLDYFQKVQKVLANGTAKRQSLIIRAKARLAEGMPLMTDAERLGYLQYQIDTLETRLKHASANKEVLAENIAQVSELKEKISLLRQELAQADYLYGIYANAEAFGIPYEAELSTLKVGRYWLEAHDPSFPQVEPSVFEVTYQSGWRAPFLHRARRYEEQLARMREQAPTGPEFYREYYRLSVLKDKYYQYYDQVAEY